MAIECKNLKGNNPLLVSRVPRLDNESFHEIITSRDPEILSNLVAAARHGVDDFSRIKVSRVDRWRTVFKENEQVGKSTAQVGITTNRDFKEFTSIDSEVSEKWRQAIASSYDLFVRSPEDYVITGKRRASTLIQPILVVADDTLWVADYTADGDLNQPPGKVTECTLYLDKALVQGGWSYTVSHLCIFTITGFEAYLKKLTSRDERYWYELFLGYFDQ